MFLAKHLLTLHKYCNMSYKSCSSYITNVSNIIRATFFTAQVSNSGMYITQEQGGQTHCILCCTYHKDLLCKTKNIRKEEHWVYHF